MQSVRMRCEVLGVDECGAIGGSVQTGADRAQIDIVAPAGV